MSAGRVPPLPSSATITALTNASYLVLASDTTLIAERRLTVDASLSQTDAGANSTLTLGVARGSTSGFVFKSAGSSSVPAWSTSSSAMVAVALTDGATISVDASLGDLFDVTFGGNRTIANPTNPSDGKKIVFRIRNDGTRTVAWDSKYRGSADAPLPSLTSGSSKLDYFAFMYNLADDKWDHLAPNKGF